MPNPTAKNVHVDGLLTNVSIGYRNPQYIADQVFPLCPVNKQSDIIPEYEQSHWFRDGARLRAPGTKSEGGGWKYKTDETYFCKRFSYRHEIDDDTRANEDLPFNQDREATVFVTDKLQMRRELAFVNGFFAASKGWTDKEGGASGAGADFVQFSDYANSSPLTDIDDYKDTIEGYIGIEPNTFVIGKPVWRKLKWHPDLIDLIKYTQKGQITVDLFSSLTEFERILIGKAIYTTDPEGTAEASVSYDRIWGKHGLMLYVPKSPSLMVPAAGYCFVWKQKMANGAIQYIKRMRDEEKEIDIIEANSYFDQKMTSGRAGLFMEGAVA